MLDEYNRKASMYSTTLTPFKGHHYRNLPTAYLYQEKLDYDLLWSLLTEGAYEDKSLTKLIPIFSRVHLKQDHLFPKTKQLFFAMSHLCW